MLHEVLCSMKCFLVGTPPFSQRKVTGSGPATPALSSMPLQAKQQATSILAQRTANLLSRPAPTRWRMGLTCLARPPLPVPPLFGRLPGRLTPIVAMIRAGDRSGDDRRPPDRGAELSRPTPPLLLRSVHRWSRRGSRPPAVWCW